MAERFQLSYDERFFAYAQLAQRALPAPSCAMGIDARRRHFARIPQCRPPGGRDREQIATAFMRHPSPNMSRPALVG